MLPSAQGCRFRSTIAGRPISFMKMNGNSSRRFRSCRTANTCVPDRLGATSRGAFRRSYGGMRPCHGSSGLRSGNAQPKQPPRRCWALPDWVFRSSVAHRRRRPAISRNPTTPRPISVSFLAKRKWPTSVWPRSISSTGKTLAAACNSPADAAVAAATGVAGAEVATAAAAATVVVTADSSAAAVAAADAAAEVAAAAAAAGSVPGSSSAQAAWPARAAPAAACPGVPAGCAEPDERQLRS